MRPWGWALLASALATVAGFAGACFVLAPVAPPPASGPLAVRNRPIPFPRPAGDQRPTALARLWYPAPRAANEDAAQRLPILIYFPGWDATAIDNRTLVRDLASHGFAVVALRYPTAREASRSNGPAGLRSEPPGAMDFSSDAALDRTIRLADGKVRGRARDAVDMLDRLEQLASTPMPDPLPPLAFDRVGILGFSLGGASAVQAAWMDGRFKAVANIDGWLFADSAPQGIPQPYLVISDDEPLPTDADLMADDPSHRNSARLDRDDLDREIRGLERHGGAMMTIRGTLHLNFSDAAFRPRLRGMAGLGPIDRRRGYRILETYTRAFFARWLQDAPTPLFDGPSPLYPEVDLQVWHRPEAKPAAANTD